MSDDFNARMDLYLTYPDSDDELNEDSTLRRPELRVSTLHASLSPLSPADTPPDSAVTTGTSSSSSTECDALGVPGFVGQFAEPFVSAQATQAPCRDVYAPPVLPQLLPEPFFRLSGAPQLQTANTDGVAPEATTSIQERRTQFGIHPGRRLSKSLSLDSCASTSSTSSVASTGSRPPLAHPYARIYAKKAEAPAIKRRKMWNHALEKSLFTPEEIATLGAPNRRAIYTASLENHVDRLHNQLLELGLYPVAFETLEPYRGLNSKTAKVSTDSQIRAFFSDISAQSMVAGLHKDACDMKTKLMELERAVRACLLIFFLVALTTVVRRRRHSIATASSRSRRPEEIQPSARALRLIVTLTPPRLMSTRASLQSRTRWRRIPSFHDKLWDVGHPYGHVLFIFWGGT